MLEQCGSGHCHQVPDGHRGQELEEELDDEDDGVIEDQDIAEGQGKHHGAVSLVNDAQSCVEVIKQRGVTCAVPLHLDEVHRVAQEVDHQQDDREDDNVDVEKPVPMGHSVQVSTNGESCQCSARHLDQDHINPVLVFQNHFQHFTRPAQSSEVWAQVNTEQRATCSRSERTIDKSIRVDKFKETKGLHHYDTIYKR